MTSPIAVGASDTVTVPAGQTLEVFGAGTVTYGPGIRNGQSHGVNGVGTFGPLSRDQIFYLGATGTAALAYAVVSVGVPIYLGAFASLAALQGLPPVAVNTTADVIDPMTGIKASYTYGGLTLGWIGTTSGAGGATLPDGYQIALDELFSTLDFSKWTPTYAGVVTSKGTEANAEYGYYADPRDASWNGYTPFSAGANGLTVSARRTSTLGLAGGQVPADAKTSAPYMFVTGAINSKATFNFRSGIIDCWMGPITETDAAWPAMWARPVVGIGGTGALPEIDFIELLGSDPSTAHFNGLLPGISYPGLPNSGQDLFAGLHWYRTIVTDTTIQFFLDGTLLWTVDISDKPLFQSLYYLLVNLAVGSNISGWAPPADTNTPNILTAVYKRIRVARIVGPDSLSVSNVAVLDTNTPGTIGTLSATSYGDSSPAYAYSVVPNSAGSSALVVSGTSLNASSALTAGNYDRVLRVVDTRGRKWQKKVTVAVVQDTITGTNKFTAPTDLTNAAWSKFGVTIATGYPDLAGGTTAQMVKESALNESHSLEQLYTKAASSISYTVALDLQAAGINWLQITLANGYADTAPTFVNLADGSMGDAFSSTPANVNITSRTIVSLGSGYYRVLLGVTVGAAVTGLRLWIRTTTGGSDYGTHTGDVTKGFIARVKMQLV